MKQIFFADSKSLIHFKGESTCFNVFGFKQDSEYQRCKCWIEEAYRQGIPEDKITFRFSGPANRREFIKDLQTIKKIVGDEARDHKHSPLIFEGCEEENYSYVGGVNEFLTILKNRYNLQDTQRCY
eukprot:TRINITY_DN566_c0_g1_i1.p1 TRINITY_DN566_c0_g1~~TRINITY_DN566_c0_g1_i1.p1  ORF type:complete len:126 (+),score=1.01 TRINITY_DN566_c0_g1_i1:33-410(+)